MNQLLELFNEYGAIIIFILIFLEHLNAPGLAAGVLLGGVGVIARGGGIHIIEGLVICILAGVLASLILYIIGSLVGKRIIGFLENKYPKLQKHIEKARAMSGSAKGRFTCRWLPVIRTIVPLVEGGMGVKPFKFLMTSIVGVGLYNSIIVLSGYFVGSILF